MRAILLAYTKIAIAMAIVGSSVVAGKLITSSFPVFLASELRFMIATIILIPLLIKREKRIPPIKLKELFALFSQAFTGVFLFNICMLYGLRYTTAIEAGILTSTLPAVVGLLSFLFLKEKLAKQKILGILFSAAGILLINQGGSESGGSMSLLGNLLIFGAVVGEALFITIGKSVSNHVSPLTIATMMSMFGLILFFPFSIYEAKHFNFSGVGIVDWLNILYFGMIVTVLAFILMYQGLSKVSASSAGVLTGVLPISSIILSSLILKEKIRVLHILGMILVFVALWFISKDSSGEERINSF
jgi:drug/metabolite transporter (DMT)-like permease